VLEKRRLLDEINYLRNQLSNRYSFANIVSRNRVMHEIFESIEVLAQNDATVLITGESGTGKELVARAVHFQGKRKSGRFVAIKLRGLPGHPARERALRLRARRLHRRGPRPRRQDRALERRHAVPRRNRVITLNMQLKLLRVLEEREVERLGGNRKVKVNMRVIAATNVELDELVADGRMREDFFYRINVVPIRIPPLRDRIEDIPLLVSEFLRNSEMAKDKGINRLSNQRLSQLMSYQWPGNVRELGNVIERAILRTSGSVIREVDLPGHASLGATPRRTATAGRRAMTSKSR
jgi:transcriptional regulator with PAS, ATPase and Fis domain